MHNFKSISNSHCHGPSYPLLIFPLEINVDLADAEKGEDEEQPKTGKAKSEYSFCIKQLTSIVIW